jgi:hypothetical protein
VCSLDLAKQLKELGVKQDSYFEWFDEGQYGAHLDKRTDANSPLGVKRYAAFTVAELGEMLPKYYATYRHSGNKVSWACDKVLENDEDSIFGPTEADARAKMLIYLLENKLI